MQSADKMLLLYIDVATRAIADIGGASEFRKLPLFGSSERTAAGQRKAA